jgi:hypothetical protein
MSKPLHAITANERALVCHDGSKYCFRWADESTKGCRIIHPVDYPKWVIEALNRGEYVDVESVELHPTNRLLKNGFTAHYLIIRGKSRKPVVEIRESYCEKDELVETTTTRFVEEDIKHPNFEGVFLRKETLMKRDTIRTTYSHEYVDGEIVLTSQKVVKIEITKTEEFWKRDYNKLYFPDQQLIGVVTDGFVKSSRVAPSDEVETSEEVDWIFDWSQGVVFERLQKITKTFKNVYVLCTFPDKTSEERLFQKSLDVINREEIQRTDCHTVLKDSWCNSEKCGSSNDEYRSEYTFTEYQRCVYETPSGEERCSVFSR